MSFNKRTVRAYAWVQLAADFLKDRFNIYNFVDNPVPGGDLPMQLNEKIERTDIFFCLLDEQYLAEGSYTQAEWEAAVRRSTRSEGGSLVRATRLPVIHVVALDEWAENWMNQHHRGFSYLPLGRYDLQILVGSKVIPRDSGLWEDLLKSIEADVDKRSRQEEVRPPEPGASSSAEQRIWFLGRPEQQFLGPVDSARKAAISALQCTPSATHLFVRDLPDGWATRDQDGRNASEKLVSQALQDVLTGARGSMLIQPCDKGVLSEGDNEGEGLSFFFRKIRRNPGDDSSRIPEPEAKAAVARTLLWVPRVGDPAIDPLEGARQQVHPLDEVDIESQGPWFGAATPEDLSGWLKLRSVPPKLKVKTERYNQEIAPKLENGLSRYLPPLNVGMVDLTKLAFTVKDAIANNSEIIVALFDKVSPAVDVFDAIQQRARETDEKILLEAGETDGHKVARAVFLVRHWHRIHDTLVVGLHKNWIFVPVPSGKDYVPPEDRIALIRDQLHLSN